MTTAKEIREFTVSENSNGIVLLSTTIPLYFFRATNDESNMGDVDFSYHLYLTDGSEVDITPYSLDIHPLLLERPDNKLRFILIGMHNCGIVSVHPKDIPMYDKWFKEQCFNHGIIEENIDWSLISK